MNALRITNTKTTPQVKIEWGVAEVDPPHTVDPTFICTQKNCEEHIGLVEK